LANSCDNLGLWFLHRLPTLRTRNIFLNWSPEMHHLHDPDNPLYVSDRLSAVSNIPTQFLVSLGIATVILVAASLPEFMPTSDESVGFVDTQKTASVSATAPRLRIGGRGWSLIVPSEYGASNIFSR
jgi:hypothetical protein